MVKTPIHRLQIRLLGAVEVAARADGEEPRLVNIGGRTQRRVLAALIVARPDVVSIDQLVDATWGEDPPSRADHNVRTYVSRLRTALGADIALNQVGDGYRIDLVDAECDIDRFDELFDTAKRLRGTGSTTDALDAISGAEALWRGRPLGEFAFEPWARTEVARLDGRRDASRELHAELLLMSGRPQEAINRLQSLIREHPLREQPRALMMRALYASGRTTEALREFQDFRTHLRDEVGLDPSTELVELDHSVARGDLPDQRLAVRIGGYELHERIGSGAFAVVHRATQSSLDREVAVKIIRGELATQPAFVRSFEREARIIARLEHDAVVPLHDFWRDPDQAYLVMRYLSGGSLADRLADGPLPMSEVLALVERVGSALTAAHAVGVLHRDVKPANILFDADGRAVLGDFGIAVEEPAAELAATARASESSARFAAPEQLAGHRPGPAVDVYSLGLVVWAALTGETPYATSPVEVIIRQKVAGTGSVESLGSRRPDLATEFVEVIDAAVDPAPDRRPGSIAELLDQVRAAVDGAPSDARRTMGEAVNPYQGLRAFDETTAHYFRGRSALVSELVGALSTEEQRIVTVIGASGSGKSSVVRAGLLPALGAGAVDGSADWFVTSMTPGIHPYESLEIALLRVAVNPPSQLLSQLTDGDRGIIRSVERLLPERDGRLLLVIDQFEELFTNAEPDVAERFLGSLATTVTEPDNRLRVVLTLRGDFYDRPLQHASFAPLLKQGTVAVTPLSPEELEEVIVEPARSVGVEFEPGLVARILSDAANGPGGLPLLQYALTLAFDRCDGSLITAADYTAIGGLDGALVRRADELHDGLGSDGRQSLRRVMGSLVALGEGTEDTRRRANRSELGFSAETEEVLDAFGRARLLTFDHDPASREPTVEVAHETLIRSWPRFRAWLDEDRNDLRIGRHLTTAAHEWDDRGRPDSELYRGGRLEAALDWQDRGAVPPSAEASAFLEASSEQAEAEQVAEAEVLAFEQRSNRRLRRSLTGVAVLLTLVLAAGAVAFQQRRSAQQTAFDAETSRLVATAQSLVGANPRAALLLAVISHERDRTAETLGALQVALSGFGPMEAMLGEGGDYVDVEWLSNGLIVGVRPDGVDLFDPETAEILDSVEVAAGRGYLQDVLENDRASVAPDVPVISVLIEPSDAVEPAVVVFDAADRRLHELITIPLPSSPTSSAVSAGGDLIAVSDVSNSLRVFGREGTEAWSLLLDESPSVYDQARPVIGDDAPLRTYLEQIRVITAIHPDPSELVVGVGSFVRRFDWEGREIGEAWPVTAKLGEGAFTLGLPNSVLLGSNGPRAVAGWTSIWSEDSAEPPHYSDAAIQLNAFAELSGAGLPKVIDGRATAVGDVHLISDGSLAILDAERLEIDRIVEPPVGGATSFAVDPTSRTRIAVAAPLEGIMLVNLLGAGPIAEGLPRPSEARNLGISENGRLALETGAGAAAPSTLFRRVDREWLEVPFRTGLIDGAGGISPGDGGFFEIRDSADLSWVYSYDDESVTELVAASPQPASTSSGRSVALGLYVFGGGFAAGDAVRVQTLPGFETVKELPNPSRSSPLLSPSGVQFDPHDERLLVAMPDGFFDVWDVSTWEQIDMGRWRDESISIGTWNSDGSLLATAAPDGTVELRDGETFEPLRTLVGGIGTSNSWNDGALLFSEDNRLLLTNVDGPGRLWDIESGQQIGQPFPSARGTNSGVNVGRNGLQLITGTERGALVWNLDVAEWPEIACRAAGSNLTENEWTQWGPRDAPFRAVC